MTRANVNLNTHVKITVEVLEKKRNVWGKYFEVEDLEGLVRDIHAAADAIVKDLPHHPGNRPQKKAFYHLMKARHIWLAVVEGQEDPKDPVVVSEFFGNLVLAMHLYQDAVINPADMKEHDFIEKKIWEIMEGCTVIDRMPDLHYSRTSLKSVGFNKPVAYFVDPEEALNQAVRWTMCLAQAVFSGRLISKTEAEKFLIRNGVMRETEVENQKFGQPIRDNVARRKESLRTEMNAIIVLAALHLLILFFGFAYYYQEYWIRGKSNLILEIWLGLTPVWIALFFALIPAKYVVLRRFDKKAVKDYERARLMDFYPTHAFFDAPHIYLEYMDGKVVPLSRKKEVKTVKA